MDAGRAETYERVRPAKSGRSNFDRVIDNMRRLAHQAVGSVGYSFLVVTRRDASGQVVFSNHDEIEVAARLAKEVGCDYFEVKAMFDDNHEIVPLPEPMVIEINVQVQAAQALASDDFAIEVSSTLMALSAGLPRQVKEYTRCPVAELRTVVTPSGALVCSYHRGRGEMRLGDASATPFLQFWSASDRSIVNPSVDCGHHCARHEQNEFLLAIGRDHGAIGIAESFSGLDPFI